MRRFDPDMKITCTETDADVVGVAKEFFGAKLDARLQVYIEEGRQFLERPQSTAPYDLVVLDASDGTGATPLRLGVDPVWASTSPSIAVPG